MGTTGCASAPSRKIRADRLVLEQELAPSREKAQALILAGRVYLGEVRVEKAGHLLPRDALLQVRGKASPFVSRGGEKLDGALSAFGIEVAGLVCADIGASTGGFTHCLLLRGARRVYAVDVGAGLIDASLRADGRVVLMERTNARYLEKDAFPEPIDFVTVDASFISLRLLLPAIARAAPHAEAVVLVKPQFEVGRGKIGKGGIVRNASDREACVRSVIDSARESGYECRASTESAIRGRKGNLESLLHLIRDPLPEPSVP